MLRGLTVFPVPGIDAFAPRTVCTGLHFNKIVTNFENLTLLELLTVSLK